MNIVPSISLYSNHASFPLSIYFGSELLLFLLRLTPDDVDESGFSLDEASPVCFDCFWLPFVDDCAGKYLFILRKKRFNTRFLTEFLLIGASLML
jgi:hypothetical protein